jgi:hypothetical protein
MIALKLQGLRKLLERSSLRNLNAFCSGATLSISTLRGGVGGLLRTNGRQNNDYHKNAGLLVAPRVCVNSSPLGVFSVRAAFVADWWRMTGKPEVTQLLPVCRRSSPRCLEGSHNPVCGAQVPSGACPRVQLS